MESSIKIVKSQFEKYEPVGKELLRQAMEHKISRNNWANSELSQACKDGAHYIANRNSSKISMNLNIDEDTYNRIFRRRNVKEYIERAN